MDSCLNPINSTYSLLSNAELVTVCIDSVRPSPCLKLSVLLLCFQVSGYKHPHRHLHGDGVRLGRRALRLHLQKREGNTSISVSFHTPCHCFHPDTAADVFCNRRARPESTEVHYVLGVIGSPQCECSKPAKPKKTTTAAVKEFKTH